MMPGTDGWTVLTRIKAETDLEISTIPVLMLTARTGQDDRIRGGIEGAIRYLTKPFDPDDLRAEVRDASSGAPEPVRRRKAQQQALEQLARVERAQPRRPAPGRARISPGSSTRRSRSPSRPRSSTLGSGRPTCRPSSASCSRRSPAPRPSAPRPKTSVSAGRTSTPACAASAASWARARCQSCSTWCAMASSTSSARPRSRRAFRRSDLLVGRCRFPPPGTRSTCAVSGGADSLALLVLALTAGCDVTAMHVDHGLRPGSAGEADVVAAAAARFGAAFRAERVERGAGTEPRGARSRRSVRGPA